MDIVYDCLCSNRMDENQLHDLFQIPCFPTERADNTGDGTASCFGQGLLGGEGVVYQFQIRLWLVQTGLKLI